MFAIPPGLVSGCGGDYSSFICVQPESINRVRAKMGLIFYGEGWSQNAIDDAVKLFKDTMAEDKTVLVDLMRGMSSRHHQRGPLAPMDLEGSVWTSIAIIVAALEGRLPLPHEQMGPRIPGST